MSPSIKKIKNFWKNKKRKRVNKAINGINAEIKLKRFLEKHELDYDSLKNFKKITNKLTKEEFIELNRLLNKANKK